MPTLDEETTTEEQDQKHLFMLEDVIVDTLGLVGKGAIGQDFFLLKSESGEPMGQDELIDQLEKLDGSEQPPSVLERIGLQRIIQLLKQGQAAEAQQPESNAPQGDSNKEDSEETMPDEKPIEKEAAEETPQGAAPAIPPDTVQEQPDIQAELKKRDEQITALMERLEKAETVKADLEKAQERVAEVEKAYQAERDARTLMTYIEKAEREYPALPAKADEIGKFLHWLAKEDQAANIEKAADAPDRQNQLGFVTELFKSVNEMAIQSGFFAEAGTAKLPKDMSLIEKAEAAVAAGEYETVKDALMKMDQAEAERYLEQYH